MQIVWNAPGGPVNGGDDSPVPLLLGELDEEEDVADEEDALVSWIMLPCFPPTAVFGKGAGEEADEPFVKCFFDLEVGDPGPPPMNVPLLLDAAPFPPPLPHDPKRPPE